MAESNPKQVVRRVIADVMKPIELVADGETVVGRFSCSGTHVGVWLGHPATGQRFEDVPEVYFFRVVEGCIVRAWGIEDAHERLRQLGLR